MTVTIAVVIPTRNRASYAIAAVRSLLDQEISLDIFVSDNSDEPDQLRDFCRGEPRVRYLRPPAVLSMPEHWDWAVRQAMSLSTASHFTVHYDRKLSKPGAWAQLASAESKTPELVMTFPADFVLAYPPPLRVWQTPWTGRTFLVRSARVAELIASGQIVGHAIPVLSNCIVPRAVLQSIVERFGDVCNSTGPDGAFLARFLALNDRYVHFDRAAGILYGFVRSNGFGYLRGTGGDFPDYLKTWGDRPWLQAAPVPGLNLGFNMLFHEYELVRRDTGRLPPFDTQAVLNSLAAELQWVEDEAMKAELRRILQQYGWKGSDPVSPPPASRWRWSVRQAVHLFRARWFGFVPATITAFSFRDDETALRYASKYPRQPQGSADHLAVLEPVEAGEA